MRFLKKYNFIFLLPVIAIYFYTRWEYLGEISYYMHIDELKAAYDSVVLARYGIAGFDKLPFLYTILCTPMMMIKGGLFSLKLFRLLSVIGGLFCILFSYLTVREMTGENKYAVLEAVLITTLPIFFISGRTGMSDYLLVEIAPAAFYFMMAGIRRSKRGFLVLSGIIWGLCLYTTAYAYLFVLLFLCSVIVYLLVIKKIDLKGVARICVPFAVLAIIFMILGQKTGSFAISNISENIKNIKAMFWDDGHPYNISSSFGTMYSFSVPILIVGVVSSLMKVVTAFRQKRYDTSVIIWLFLVTAFVGNLLVSDIDVQKGNIIFFPITLVLTEGLTVIAENLKGALAIEIAVYLVCFWFFTGYYYENFNSEVNNSPDHEMGIVVDKSVGEAIKASVKLMPNRNVNVVTENFINRNLMIALYGGASHEEYEDFKDKETFEFGKIRILDQMDEYADDNSVYIINEAEYRDAIESLSEQGWSYIYLKEYTVLFRQ